MRRRATSSSPCRRARSATSSRATPISSSRGSAPSPGASATSAPSSGQIEGRMARIDPLTPEQRAALLAAPRPRSLPLAPAAGKRRLPLAATTRPQDEACRPTYAVWEITLACDLGCRHCGSRAGKPRPDELTTAECLDLVRQLDALGVLEVTLIGGEAYLRDDWTEIVREIRRLGMEATLTTGGRGMTLERAERAAAAGLQSASVSLDGLEPTHGRG